MAGDPAGDLVSINNCATIEGDTFLLAQLLQRLFAVFPGGGNIVVTDEQYVLTTCLQRGQDSGLDEFLPELAFCELAGFVLDRRIPRCQQFMLEGRREIARPSTPASGSLSLVVRSNPDREIPAISASAVITAFSTARNALWSSPAMSLPVTKSAIFVSPIIAHRQRRIRRSFGRTLWTINLLAPQQSRWRMWA